MSLHDPASRPWGTAKGARIISLSAWAVVAVSAMLAAAWWVRMILGDESALTPSIVAFNVSIFAALGALFIDLGTAQRRGIEETSALPHLPGAWLIGAGVGTIAAVTMGPAGGLTPLLWGLLMFASGALAFISPNLLARYRDRRAHRHSQTRASGIRTQATVTKVSTVYREHSPRYRVTLRFTDQQGNQRWFTQTAPGAARSVADGTNLPLHSDAANPARKRTLVVDWPTW